MQSVDIFLMGNHIKPFGIVCKSQQHFPRKRTKNIREESAFHWNRWIIG